MYWQDFPGDLVENSACNAGDTGSNPGQGTKIPRASEQLSMQATTRGSVCRNERSHVPQPRPHVAR